MKKVLIIVAVIVVMVVFIGIGTYNGMVSASENVDNAFSDVETQLQRRSDLIPNLVATVKGYASHEEKIFTEVAEARAKLAGAIEKDDVSSVETANKEMESALSRLLAIAENYPDLKASEQFTALQDELAGTENRIQRSRELFNTAVKSYNLKIKTFPNNILAGIFGFGPEEYFEAEDSAKEVPTVNFDM